MSKVIWPEIENYFAGKTISTNYLTKEVIELKDLVLWSNVALE